LSTKDAKKFRKFSWAPYPVVFWKETTTYGMRKDGEKVNPVRLSTIAYRIDTVKMGL
jgi:hypothetical protein